MKKVLFIDRDGTLVKEPEDEQLDNFNKLEFLPGVFTWLGKIASELDYTLVMVSNQDGLGTNSFPEDTFTPVHQFIITQLKNEGIYFEEELIDRSFPHENKPTRKPGIGMMQHYFNGEWDLSGSFVIGDRMTDIELAANLGAKGIFISTDERQLGTGETKKDEKSLSTAIACQTSHWKEIYSFLCDLERTTEVKRVTSETEITVKLNLDGTGKADISTGLGFYDHMLEQIARHGQVDLYVNTRGDLHIDEHHTIEDTAIVLGEAFRKALGNKRGIERYGFCLPMDDCLAQVALDFGGRSWLEWDAEFKREKVGEMPTEMFYHFFKSFSDAARCNLNVKAEGANEHHKIEAIFKAFAKSIKIAVRKEKGNMALPSTKGIL
ncbi:MAG: bifunctional histidinol-phosphatase/imidazoleglycerol-phosphate dehydratase HisB [Cyclobacteriaceae bacterium]|nr:bifunctional histidinol-phosphatase/imidazoleglycerol-phosphate dehydratase HisB [Cyclobacteriaceae bacterium]